MSVRPIAIEHDVISASHDNSKHDVILKSRHDDNDAKQRVALNVGGVRHDTYLATLRKFPNTRLARLAAEGEKDDSFDQEAGEYFFDRHSEAFRSVLEYCRTGELHASRALCGSVLKQVDIANSDALSWIPIMIILSRYKGSICRGVRGVQPPCFFVFDPLLLAFDRNPGRDSPISPHICCI